MPANLENQNYLFPFGYRYITRLEIHFYKKDDTDDDDDDGSNGDGHYHNDDDDVDDENIVGEDIN